jgi:hypothetical protein
MNIGCQYQTGVVELDELYWLRGVSCGWDMMPSLRLAPDEKKATNKSGKLKALLDSYKTNWTSTVYLRWFSFFFSRKEAKALVLLRRRSIYTRNSAKPMKQKF